MSNVQKYIDEARQKAQRKRYPFVSEPGMNQAFVRQRGLYSATGSGAGPGANVKKSRPYIVIVSSASGAAVTDFEILGANDYLNNSGFNAAGSLVIGSVTIYSGIPNVNYRYFLYQTQQSPFTVGQTYIACTNQTAQVQEAFTVITTDSNGIKVEIPIVPAIDPYQQQTGVIVNEDEYSVDGGTKLKIATLLANAVVTFRFYPSVNVNVGRQLTDQSSVSTYGNPGTIR
jgi:hypothetical protein